MQAYIREACISRNSKGAVYKARTQGGDVVALKTLSKTRFASKAAFVREVDALRELVGCGRVVNFRDCFEDCGTYYIVTDYVHGDHVKVRQSEASLRHVVRGALEAVTEMQAHRIIHCDISPNNVLIDNRGVVLIDFGASCRLPERVNNIVRDRVYGTPICMAPEVLIKQETTVSTDTYAIGALAYFAATGRPIYGFHDNWQSMLQAVLSNKRNADGDCSRDLLSFVESCTASDWRQRPPARDLIEHPWVKELHG